MAKSKDTTNGASNSESPKQAPELVKKISLKVVNDGEDIKAPDAPVDFFTVIGVVQGFKVVSSQYGDSIGFLGNFEAIRATDGKRFMSGTLYLPSMLSDILHAAVRSAQADDADATVKVAGVVGLKPSKKAAVGYEYTFRPLIDVVPVDALADLRAVVAGALPAPTTSDASAA
jgi:hypothetical protein